MNRSHTLEKAYLGEQTEFVSLARYTTWRIGGTAKHLYKPKGIEDLACYLRQLDPSLPLLWLGLGSNTLIRDGGFDGAVVLTQGCLKNIEVIAPNTVRVEAGVSCASMARFCARHDLGHAEFWAGIPGTMGGALRMNAGCYDGETWDHVVEVETMTRTGQIHYRPVNAFQVRYREVSGLAPDEGLVAATFKLPDGDKAQSLQTIKSLLERRTQTQPTNEYNCGSVFRNPPGHHAGHLIETCGLKGFKIGGAKVSTKHANFIINEEGKASAQDIESLIKTIQETVYEKAHLMLQHEVHIIGDLK